MFGRLGRKIWNAISGEKMTEEEYSSNMSEFITNRSLLIDAVNPMFSIWNREWENGRPGNEVLRKGTFEYRCYGRFIADKMNEIATTINKNNRRSNILIGVCEREGEPIIFGEVKDRKDCILELPWYA